MCGEERNGRRTSGSNGIAHPLEEVILDQRQQNSEENQDVGRITEVAVLEINETNRIRELYREFCEIPETEKEKDVSKRQEVGKEWTAMGKSPKWIARIELAN